MVAKQKLYTTSGKRKKSIARAFLNPAGKGKITINDTTIDQYFEFETHRNLVLEPLKLLKLEKAFDILLTVKGGGKSGQADAVRLAIARGILKHDPTTRKVLKPEGMLSVDARKKERKKYGKKKARKSPQFSKR